MPTRLILNADDFGLTAGINRAIAELYAAGALCSATLMATGPAFEDAVRTAKEHPALGVGCHVVLTDGVPISPPEEIPSLVEPGGARFRPSLGRFLAAVQLGRVREEDILHEATAQIQKLQRAGIAVTHLDTHKHTHLFPGVLRPVLEAATRCGVRAVRNPFEPAWAMRLGHGSRLRRAAFRVLRQRFEGSFRGLVSGCGGRVATTDGTLAISATGELDATRLAEILAALPVEGTWELVVHPGYRDAALDAVATRLRSTREVERAALQVQIPALRLSPGAPKLIHYGSLAPFQPERSE